MLLSFSEKQAYKVLECHAYMLFYFSEKQTNKVL